MDRRLLIVAVLVLAIAGGATQADLLKIEPIANGAKVEIGKLQGRAQRVWYDEVRRRLVLEGGADVPATIFLKRYGTQEVIQGRKIVYSLKDGSCQVRGGSWTPEP